jgi:large conductance mechanosensitive channel
MKNNVFNFWNEFREFAFKGSMVDLAIGIIIGTGFNDLVQSLVKNIIMPPVGKLLGNVDFSSLYINLSNKSYDTLRAAEAAGAPVIRYGLFLSNVIDFIILALTIFLVLRIFLKQKNKVEKSEK